MREKVEAVLEDVRKALRLHAGGIELVSLDEAAGRVEVRLTGTCDGCALAKVTLKQGVETALARAIPEIREVVAQNV
ncbi:NifU family protein [Patescibacteria group bacterium]|nr:NifU family protein [Patescibacteria group bacterium]